MLDVNYQLPRVLCQLVLRIDETGALEFVAQSPEQRLRSTRFLVTDFQN
jgi:hypothetical protein